MKRTSIYIIFSLLVLACTGIKKKIISKERHTDIELGQLVDSRGVLYKDIEVKTGPTLLEPLRITLSKEKFTPSLYRKYATSHKNSVVSIDTSLAHYYEIELIDDVGYIKSINNDDVLTQFVQDNLQAGVVTRVSVAIRDGSDIAVGSSYFLKQSQDGVYHIEIQDATSGTNVISFSDFMVFDYDISSFCYGLNYNNEAQLVDLIEQGKSCKRPLRRTIKRLKKEKNLFDY